MPPPPASPQPNGPTSLPQLLTPPTGGLSPAAPSSSPNAPPFTFFGRRRRTLQGDGAEGSADGDEEDEEAAKGAVGVEGMGVEGPVDVGGGGVGAERRELLAQDELQAALEVRVWLSRYFLNRGGGAESYLLLVVPCWRFEALQHNDYPHLMCPALRLAVRALRGGGTSRWQFWSFTSVGHMHGVSRCHHGACSSTGAPLPAPRDLITQGRSVRLVLTSGPEARETSSAAAAEALSLFTRELQVGVLRASVARHHTNVCMFLPAGVTPLGHGSARATNAYYQRSF